MTHQGTVRHGVVVLEGGATLEEGTVVRVEPVQQTRKYPRGSAQAILQHAGTWAGPDEEIDRLLAELRQMKQDELREQLKKPDIQL